MHIPEQSGNGDEYMTALIFLLIVFAFLTSDND